MSNEVIAFACPKCGKKLRVKAALAGKAAACPGCQTRLRVPTPKTHAAAQSAQAAPSASAANRHVGPASTSSNPAMGANSELGIGAGLRHENDIFGDVEMAPNSPKHNPLGNHVVEDPGFATTIEPTDRVKSAPTDSFARNPLIVQMEEEEERRRAQMETIAGLKSDEATGQKGQVALTTGVLFGIAFFFAFMLGITSSPSIGIIIAAVALGILLGPVSLGVQIWGLVLIARNEKENATMHILLFLFVPFYSIIFTFMRWKYLWEYFVTLCVIAGVSGLGVVFMVLIGVIAGQEV